MHVFPTYSFNFSDVSTDVERRVTSGGTSLSGQVDVISTDGGGRVFAEFSEPYLDDERLALAWRANTDYLSDGLRPVIVPLCDLRHQFGQDIRVPSSLPWWTEEESIPSNTGAALASDTAHRATTLAISISYLPKPIEAGMWFSIDHATMRHRAYRVAEVISQTHSDATIKISHPLREAAVADLAVDFIDPRCVMRLDGSMRSPTSFGFTSAPAIRFVEDFRGTYE